MTYYVGNMPVGEEEEYLAHWGVKGMKWGRRRYQNRNGSLTAEGRLRYGYGRARRWGQQRARSTKNWYQKNKKTIKRAAAITGGVAAAAGAAYLGKRYGKSAVRSAKRVMRAAPFKVRAIGYKANAAKARLKVNSRMFGQNVKNTAGGVRSKVKTGVTNFGIKRNAAKLNRKLAKAQGEVYKKTGIVGDKMTKGQKRFIDTKAAFGKKATGVKNKASSFYSQAKFDLQRQGRKVGLKAKTMKAKAKVGANASIGKAKNKISSATSQAKFDLERQGRKIGLKAKTAKAKVKVGARSAFEKAKTRRSTKRKVRRQVNDAFNSPTRYLRTHTRSQIRRDVARNLTGRVVGATVGATAGTAAANYISRSKKKKSRRR